MSQDNLQKLLERVDQLVTQHLDLQARYQQLSEENQQLLQQHTQTCATIERILVRLDALEQSDDF